MRQMNGGDFRKAFGFVAVGLMGLGASAIDITEDTTVTGADIATYATADINISDGKTLTLSAPDKSYTFTGALSGSGNLVVKAASAGTYRVTLSGNSPDFTGGVYITNLPFTVTAPAALGQAAKFTAKANVNARSYLQGEGEYASAFDVSASSTDSADVNYGLKLDSAETVISGDVTWRGGFLLGPGKVTGKITHINTHLWSGDGLHIAGGTVSSASNPASYRIAVSGGRGVWIDAPVNSRLLWYGSGTIHMGCANALNTNDRIVYFGGSKTEGRAILDLNGYDQNMIFSVAPSYFEVTSKTPATLKVTKTLENTVSQIGYLTGAASLYYVDTEANSTQKLQLSGHTHTTTGTITVQHGTLTILDGAKFKDLEKFVMHRTGTNKPKMAVPAGAKVDCRASFSETYGTYNSNGKWPDLNIGEGAVVRFTSATYYKSATETTAKIAPGDYVKGGTAFGNMTLSGTGIVRIQPPLGFILLFR